jgi:hypothetical protein
VTQEVDLWVKNLESRYDFLLRGRNENPRGEDDASCLSRVDHLKLTIEYEVPWQRGDVSGAAGRGMSRSATSRRGREAMPARAAGTAGLIRTPTPRPVVAGA